MVNKINYPDDLPIVACREEIVAAIRANPVVVVAGETGSGKTTQLPKMCLEAGRGVAKLIGCTQPRRIAALTIAARVKEELGPVAGGVVGAKVRFHDQTTRATRIKFMTDGILLAEAQHDRLLRAYDTIIIDEAHERSLNIDFLLGILHRLLARRADLKVIITSATIDTAKFAQHFRAPVITVSGRGYPVEVIYRPLAEEETGEGELSPVERAITAVRELRQLDRQGDILVFMPTERDIVEMVESMQRQESGRGGREFANAAILPLFGRLAAAEQSRIFQPVAGQKIVVATNVAETSVTVPGIRYVVDTGLARVASYNARARTTKLPVVAVSRASADQRRGRCGRVGPGVCLRLYSQEDFENRPEFTLPEIQRANLAEVILRMLSLQLGDPANFPFLDPPAPRSVKDGYDLLEELGAIRRAAPGQGGVTLSQQGRLMARLPLDPRIARMIIAAREENALAEVVVIAAALSIQDPRLRPPDKEKEADAAHAQFAEQGSDFYSFLKIWQACLLLGSKSGSQNQVRKFCQRNFLSWQRVREWRDVHAQICQVLAEEGGFLLNADPAAPDGVHRAILSGSLRHIGYKKEKNLYVGGQGKELVVFPGSALANKAGQWIMAAELVETSRLYARTVANIKPEWLEGLAGPLLCRYSYSDPHWEKKRGQVVATEKVTLFGLVIVAGRKVNFGRIRPEEARQLFIAALVAGEVEGNYKFLRHNRQLVIELEEVEHRVRQRDILVDEYSLSQFYEQRLPAEICDLSTLNRQRRELELLLRMVPADITNQEPDHERLADFPVSVDTGEFSLPLSYKFAPGNEADGVSVMIPMAMVGEVQEDIFEWLVPGLLLEKIVCLLKGLPKAIRKQLVPIPQTAQELLDALPLNQGSLYAALEREIRRRFGVLVARKQWPVAALPPHLTVRYCLVDGQGQAVQAGRELHGLRAQAVPSEEGFSWPVARAQWERAEVMGWDFAELPARIPLKNAEQALTGFVYPALVAEAGGGVALRLLPDLAASRSATRAGLLALYLLSFKKQAQAARKEFVLTTKEWALNEGFAPLKQMNEGLATFILEELFAVREGRIPSREEYAATIARVEKEGLLLAGGKIFALLKEVLVARRQLLDLIARYSALPGVARAGINAAEYLRQLRQLLPEDFLLVFDLERLQALPRYLKALAIRVERAHADPAKDLAKAAQVTAHEERLRHCLGHGPPTASQELLEERRRLLAEYGRMIEEFKVSLFAPEVKTAFPISSQRLEKKWLEMERVY